MKSGTELVASERADVGRRFDADVVAIEMAVSIEECLAASMRVKARRCVCASTMAILIGTSVEVAYRSAACRAMEAPIWLSVGREIVAEVFDDIALRAVSREKTEWQGLACVCDVVQRAL